MLDFKQLHINALLRADWLSTDQAWQCSLSQKSWLVETGSMTTRLQSYCQQLRVDDIKQYDINSNQLTAKERLLLGDQRCLVREVLLLGDEKPWVVARTLIPYSTLCDKEQDLAKLGSTPLGLRVFSCTNSYRDSIEIAQIDMTTNHLLARRSRLWINDKPLLVAELFLPQSPIFGESN